MENIYYEVYVNEFMAAGHMTLDYAIIFVKSIFETYYNDKDTTVKIVREDKHNG